MELKTQLLENMMELYEYTMCLRVLCMDTLTLVNELERFDELLDEMIIEIEIYSLQKFCLGYLLS
jgi:hypothetical protein